MCASTYLWRFYYVVIWYCKWTILGDVTEICNPGACLQTFANWSSCKPNDPLLIDDLVLKTRSMLANTRSTRRLHGQQIEGKGLLVQSRSRKSFCDLELDYIVSFSPGWNFAPPTGLKRLLWLHAQFQPGRKTQISVRKFTEVRKQSMRMLAFFFRNGLKFCFDYMRLFQIFRPVGPGWKS